MIFFGHLTDSIMIIFIYLSTVLYETGNFVKQVPGGEGLTHPSFPESNLLYCVGQFD